MAGGFGIGRDDDSPWASEQPVPAAPIEFEWAPAKDAGDEWSARDAVAAPEPREPADHGEAQRHDVGAADRPDHGKNHQGDPPEPPDGASRRRLAVIAGVAVLAVTVGVLTFVRDDPAVDGPGAADATSTTAADDPTSSTAPPATLAEQTEVVTASSRPEEQTAGSETEATSTWTETTIPLPAALRALSAITTVVAIDSDGTYWEIELPTGRVDSVQLRRSAGNAQLVVGATSSLIATYPGGSGAISYLLRVGEDPIELRLESERNEMVAIPTTDEYVGTVFDYSSRGRLRETRVLADGSTETVEITDDIPSWQQSYAPTGDRLIDDAGGVYRLADGADADAERVSTGSLIAVSTNHLLVRECDEVYDCVHVLIDARTNERRTVSLGDAFDPLLGGGDRVSVSPDGNHLHHVSFGPQGAEEVIIDLATGDVVTLTSESSGHGSNVWAADSSGVFRAHRTSGLQYVDRTTGEVTPFAQDIVGSVTDYAVRADRDVVPAVPASPVTSGLAVIGLGREGDVYRIDIDTGAVISTDSPPLASGAPAFVVADPQGATIVSYDNVPSIRFDALSGTAALAGESPSGPLLPGPLPGTVWQQDRAGPGAPFQLDLVDVEGTELGQVLDIGADTELLGSDGTGGVLFGSEIGGVYRIATDGPPARITSGEVLAIGATVAYVRECDEQFVCGVFRLDRATGERVLTAVPALELAGGDLSAGGPLGQSVSPDGNIALVRVTGFGTEWTIVDLASSTSVPVPGAAVASPMLWSADSQWALYLSGDVLRLYDRASGGLRTLNNLPELKAFGAAVELAAPPEASAAADETSAASGGSAIVGGPVSS